ncbi:MAG: DUF362 domain-containing protein [Bacteroidota bacterium]
MDRRDFLRAGVAAGALAFGLPSRSFAAPPRAYDLVAVRNAEPDAMFDAAIKSLGGMAQFVRKGQTVVLKPNIGWDVPPEMGGNTNPVLVRRIVEHCFDAGASRVYVFDHTCDDWRRCYATSGIERAAEDAGATVVSGDSERYYQEVSIPGVRTLTSAKVHELILDSDVFINVPILKSHGGSQLTISMKNLMGIVWDRALWHRRDLHGCIAEFATYPKPDLNVVDAYYVMTRNGPRGVSKADVVTMKSLVLSRDMVAADAAAAKLCGMDPENVAYIRRAHDLRVGTRDLTSLSIKRIAL